METEAYVETFTEYGKPLFITIKLSFYKDENLHGKEFWAYDVLSIKAVCVFRGESYDYDINEDDYESEIKKACDDELHSYIKAA